MISGLQAALVSEVRDFPAPVVELKKAMIGLKPNRERIQNLTRDAIRELLQRPDLCAKLRANNCDNRHKKLNSEVEKLRNWVGNLVHSVPYTPYHIVRDILGVFHLV